MVHYDHALPVGGNRWAVIGGPTSAGSHAISVRNADGSIAWEQVGQYGNSGYMGAVALLPDSGLLEAGVMDGCDYFGPDSRVRRYAPDGTVLWEKFMLFGNWWMAMVAEGSTDHIAIASQDSVHILDMDGNSVGGFDVPSADLENIHWASDSTLFLMTGTDLKRYDLQGNALVSTPIGSDVMDLHWGGQQLFVLADDSVHRFNAGLVPLGSNAMADLDGNSRFVVSDSALYVTTATGLYLLAADGTPTLLFPWPALPNLTTTGCAVRNGVVLQVGNTNISDRNTGIVRTLTMGGVPVQHDPDVEVLLEVDSAWTHYAGTPFYPWNRKADVTGFVVNHGTDTLRSVVLSMWKYVPFLLCDPFTNRIDTAGFALAPGDTISLPFGVVDVALGLTENQVADSTGDICIVALAPDRLADRSPTDNTACTTVDFVMGMEGPKDHVPLSVFPNPASNACTVTGLAALGGPVHVRVLDLAGRTVAERFSDAAGNSLELDVSGLPPGTCILRAEGVIGRAMIKLVIARP
ncbi:MAG: T9SS type A sorting domain-containing protein [Flavobacteriales bacterium]|nr:T9SS type A sorting domain-containing protein [Flavobacteriales bacterium]NUQ16431.1 T9SS type A sorting domain-containing protein [Flavobacteriales bacterium]